MLNVDVGAKSSEEKAKREMVDVFRLADEFGAEQDNSNNLPKTAKNWRWSSEGSRLTPVKTSFREQNERAGDGLPD